MPADASTLDWLLDPRNPSARYLALTKILDQHETVPAVKKSRAEIPRTWPARDILMAQYPQGHWMHPGIGYSPRYRATIWQILILAQLGAGRCAEIDRAVEHLSIMNQANDGPFRASSEPGDTPVGLNASLLWALETMGYGEMRSVGDAWSWLLETATVNDLADRSVGGHDSLWEAIKVLWALNSLPAGLRGEGTARLSASLARWILDRPPRGTAGTPARLQLTFPLIGGADFLQWLEVLVDAEYGEHQAVEPVLAWLHEKRRSDGAWSLDRIPGKMWSDVGEVGKANKWITIRALSLIHAKQRFARTQSGTTGG